MMKNNRQQRMKIVNLPNTDFKIIMLNMFKEIKDKMESCKKE